MPRAANHATTMARQALRYARKLRSLVEMASCLSGCMLQYSIVFEAYYGMHLRSRLTWRQGYSLVGFRPWRYSSRPGEGMTGASLRSQTASLLVEKGVTTRQRPVLPFLLAHAARTAATSSCAVGL